MAAAVLFSVTVLAGSAGLGAAAGGSTGDRAATLSTSPVAASDAWKPYVLGNDASVAKPVAVASSSGNVSNAQALVTGSGTTTLTNTAGQAPPTIVLDYGKEVGGLPFFNVQSASPVSPATSTTLRAGYSELLRYVTSTATVSTTLAVAAPAGATNVPVNSVTNFFVGSPITIDTGANAETGTITSVGTASASSSLFTPASAGDTNVKVTSVTGLTNGAPLTVEPGPNQEQVTITNVGTAGTASTVAAQNVTSGLSVPTLTGANWIWNAPGANTSTTGGPIYLRKTFTVADPSTVSSAVLRVAADDGHTTFVNGTQVSATSGATNSWQTSQINDIKSLLVAGTNVVAISPFNGAGNAGSVIAALEIDSTRIVSDGTWKALPGNPASPPAGWNTAGFDDSSWQAANVTGAYGIAPWNTNVATPPGPTTLRVASVTGFAAGDTISIDSGANQETKVIQSVGTAGATGSGLTLTTPLSIVHSVNAAVRDTAKPGTGITFTPALSSAHAALSSLVSLGSGISFTPALANPHAAGATVSTTATTVAGDANGNNGVGTDGSRADNFTLTSAAGGTTVGNAVTLVQGGERFQAIQLTAPGTVVLSGAGITIKHYNQGADSYQGYFLSSDDTLNKIWYDGVYTDQTDSILPGGVCSSATVCSQTSTILDGAKRDRRPWSGDLTTENRTMFASLGYGPGASDVIKNTIGQFGNTPQANGSICGQISNWINYPTSSVSCSFYSPTYSMYWSRGLQQLYLYTGDIAFAEAQYQHMKNELAFDRTSWNSTTGLTTASGSDWDFYDGAKCGTGCATAATNMLYYDDLAGAAWLAQQLAQNDPGNANASTWAADAATWSSQAAALKTAINSQLFNTAKGVYQLSTATFSTHAATSVPQDANSQAVVFGVAPSDKTSGILSYLKNNLWGTFGPQPYSPDAAFATTISPFISGFELDARFTVGDTAGALALTRLMWAQMVDPNNVGYTGTLWERLGQNGNVESSNASQAHGWGTAPVFAFTDYLLGVKPTSPGFKTWSIAPQPGDLPWAQGNVPVPGASPIASRWQVDNANKTFVLTMSAPAGTSGTVSIPELGSYPTIARDGQVVWAGGAPVNGASASEVNGRVVFSNVTGSATFAEVLDAIAPTTTETQSPATPDGLNGWYLGSVQVTLAATDDAGGSGVASKSYTVDGGPAQTYTAPFTVSGSGVHVVQFWSTDNAGNVEAVHTATIKIDLNPPTSSASISPAERNGWYASPTVTLTGADPNESGIDHISYRIDGEPSWHTYTGPLSGFSTGNHFVQFQATDVAGRVESTVNLVAFKVDAVKPSVTVTRPDDGAVYPLDKVVTAVYKCVDRESGIDTCVGTVANGANLDTSTVGDHTFTVTGTDRAGNVTVVTRHYQVVYTWQGFFSPVGNEADQSLNLVHAGDLIKVGFGLNGDRGLNIGTFSSTPVSCPSWTPHSVPAGGQGTTAGLTYGQSSGHYTYGWQTSSSWAGTCRRFSLALNDGTAPHTAVFMFFA